MEPSAEKIAEVTELFSRELDPYPDCGIDYDRRENVRCPVCLDLYLQPKILACGHLLCASCLNGWLSSNQRPVNCPVCRGILTDQPISASTTADEISAGLPTDLAMAELAEAHRMLKGPHTCKTCGAEASSVCLDCCHKLCGECRSEHAKVTKAAAEREASLKADGDGGAAAAPPMPKLPYVAPRVHRIETLSSLTPTTAVAEGAPLCDTHAANQLFRDYFCLTHEEHLCRLCVADGHRECSLTTSQLKAEESRQRLKELGERLARQAKMLQQEEAYLLAIEQEAEALGQAARDEITALMDAMSAGLVEGQERVRADMLAIENLPQAQRGPSAAVLIASFSERLHDIMSLDKAEAALQRYEDYRRESCASITQRMNRLLGGGMDGGVEEGGVEGGVEGVEGGVEGGVEEEEAGGVEGEVVEGVEQGGVEEGGVEEGGVEGAEGGGEVGEEAGSPEPERPPLHSHLAQGRTNHMVHRQNVQRQRLHTDADILRETMAEMQEAIHEVTDDLLDVARSVMMTSVLDPPDDPSDDPDVPSCHPHACCCVPVDLASDPEEDPSSIGDPAIMSVNPEEDPSSIGDPATMSANPEEDPSSIGDPATMSVNPEEDPSSIGDPAIMSVNPEEDPSSSCMVFMMVSANPEQDSASSDGSAFSDPVVLSVDPEQDSSSNGDPGQK